MFWFIHWILGTEDSLQLSERVFLSPEKKGKLSCWGLFKIRIQMNKRKGFKTDAHHAVNQETKEKQSK